MGGSSRKKLESASAEEVGAAQKTTMQLTIEGPRKLVQMQHALE
jgi:hypothetical protein